MPELLPVTSLQVLTGRHRPHMQEIAKIALPAASLFGDYDRRWASGIEGALRWGKLPCGARSANRLPRAYFLQRRRSLGGVTDCPHLRLNVSRDSSHLSAGSGTPSCRPSRRRPGISRRSTCPASPCGGVAAVSASGLALRHFRRLRAPDSAAIFKVRRSRPKRTTRRPCLRFFA